MLMFLASLTNVFNKIVKDFIIVACWLWLIVGGGEVYVSFTPYDSMIYTFP